MESLIYNALIINIIVYVVIILPIWPLKIRKIITEGKFIDNIWKI